jgi:hypothetical protein
MTARKQQACDFDQEILITDEPPKLGGFFCPLRPCLTADFPMIYDRLQVGGRTTMKSINELLG